MGMHNAAARRYLREIRKGLPCTGKQKRLILKQIKESINAFVSETSDADYAAVAARFGTPQQIIASYLEEMDLQDLARHLKIRRKIIGIVSAVALIIVVLWVGVVSFALIKNQNQADGHHVVEVIEVDRRAN